MKRWMHVGWMLALCGVALAEDAALKPIPFTISKETTILTGPLLKDGRPDYWGVYNRQHRKGVTPKNNGYAQLLLALGRREDPERDAYYASLCKELGLTQLPKAKSAAIWPEEEHLYEQFHAILSPHKPWPSAADRKKLIECLVARESLEKALIHASQRPQWFRPVICTPDGEVEFMLGVSIQGATRFLCVQSWRRFQQGDFPGAIQDLQAVEQLAKRLSEGPFLIDCLIGIGCVDRVTTVVGHMLSSRKLKPDQLKTLTELLADHDLTESIRKVMTTTELWTDADDTTLRLVHPERLKSILDTAALWGDESDELAASGWRAIQRDMKQLDGDVLLKELCMLSRDLTLLRPSASWVTYRKVLDAHSLRSSSRKKEVPLGKGDTYNPALLAAAKKQGVSPVTRWLISYYQSSKANLLTPNAIGLSGQKRMERRLMRVALGLELYRSKKGTYPKTLAEMKGVSLKTIPADFFADGKPLHYKPASDGKGYLLYSVGTDGKDDGGVVFEMDIFGKSPIQPGDVALGMKQGHCQPPKRQKLPKR
jgi:hypothetical protein